MKNITKNLLIILIIGLTGLTGYSQSNRDWWNNLSPGWKKVFQKQELKGKNIDPTDEQLGMIMLTTKLDCSGNKDIEDLKPLARLKDLEEIRCNDTQIKGLEGIENLINLRVLDCSNNDFINSLKPLATLVRLEKLNCGNTMVKDLSPLKNLANLRNLDVSFCTVNKLYVIGDLKNLEVLDVSRNESLFDIQGAERLINLIEFNFSNTKVDDLTPVRDLKRLEIINLSNTAVYTLRPLQMMKTIREIDCSNTLVTAASLDYLFAHFSLVMLRARSIAATQEELDIFSTLFSKKNPNCTVIVSPQKVK